MRETSYKKIRQFRSALLLRFMLSGRGSFQVSHLICVARVNIPTHPDFLDSTKTMVDVDAKLTVPILSRIDLMSSSKVLEIFVCTYIIVGKK